MVTKARVWIVFRRCTMLMWSLAGPLLTQRTVSSVVLEAAVVHSVAFNILDCRCYQSVRLAVEKKHRQFEDFGCVSIVDAEIRFGRIQLLTARVNFSCMLFYPYLDPVKLLWIVDIK